MMRRGDDPKLAPAEEQAQLEKLRIEREGVSRAKLQAEAQRLARDSFALLDMEEVPMEAAKLAKECKKYFTGFENDAVVTMTLCAVLGVASRPVVSEEDAKKAAVGKKGGSKKANPLKAKTEKILPPTGAAVKKALLAHAPLLAQVAVGNSGQLALLRGLASWFLSEAGSAAIEKAPTVLEALYDADLADEDVFNEYWADVQLLRAREKEALVAATAQHAEADTAHATAVEALKNADWEEQDAAHWEKRAATEHQNARCGSNPNKDDEAREKAAMSALKKSLDLHAQKQKVVYACRKKLAEELTEFDAAQKDLADRTIRATGGIERLHNHAAPFFEWLATAADDTDDD